MHYTLFWHRESACGPTKGLSGRPLETFGDPFSDKQQAIPAKSLPPQRADSRPRGRQEDTLTSRFFPSLY